MIDTHTHLTDRQYRNDVSEIIDRAVDSGLNTIITIGSNLDDSKQCLELALKYSTILASVGIHPHQAKLWTADARNELFSLGRYAIAIGEIGLDYYYTFSEKWEQKRAFIEQLSVALDLHKPVIIHCRDASDDLFDIIRRTEFQALSGVIHCFSGTKSEAMQLIRLGWYLSFNGILTFKNSRSIQDILSSLPIDRILIETDCPYLTPMPHRGKRNEPMHVRHVYEKIIQLRNIEFDFLKHSHRMNCQKLFGNTHFHFI